MNSLRSLKCRLGMTVVLFMAMSVERLKAQDTAEVVWQRCIGGSDVESSGMLRPTSDGGFICIGYGNSVDGEMSGAHGAEDILVAKLNADGTIQWRRVLGGSQSDIGVDCFETSDGSIMVLGTTSSNDGDVTGNHGAQDVWVVKLSPLGSTIWQRAYGGTSVDLGGRIQEVGNGRFAIMGGTLSGDGDVVGYHSGPGTEDVWVFEVNAAGDLEWSRAFGGSGNEYGGSLLQTADGGFLLSSSRTDSNDGDVVNHRGNGDCWLAKLSSAGSLEWSRTVGGSQNESGAAVLELDNGDLILVGQSGSNDGDISQNRGGDDILLARISGSGELLWARTYGGSLLDYSSNLLRTADGGFLVAGASSSNDLDVSGNQGGLDAWLLKVDASGTMQWQRSLGGSQTDLAKTVKTDGDGYIISGQSFSNNGDVHGNHGGDDLWLVRLSENGAIRWQRCLGGSGGDNGQLRTRTVDAGYVLLGNSSSNNGDVSENRGQQDIWVVKLKVNEAPEPVEPLECALFVPNAFSPNNSTTNDAQCIYGTDCVSSMSFNIFDRWGNKVFASTDPKACWDGTYNGQALDPAVFVYHLSATLANGDLVERQGNISLVR